VLRIARTQLDGEVERLKEANLKLQQEVEEMGLRAQAAEGDRDMVLKVRVSRPRKRSLICGAVSRNLHSHHSDMGARGGK
jgi:hypothetical protein